MAVANRFEGLCGRSDLMRYAFVTLRDDDQIHANSVAELCSDLADVRNEDVERLAIGMGLADVSMDLVSYDDLRPDQPGYTELVVEGTDHTKAYGIAAQLQKEVGRRFDALASEEVERNPKDGGGVSIGSLTVGAGSVAIAGTGDAASSSRHKVESQQVSQSRDQSGSQPWWNNPWLVAIIGGALAAVIAGIILALVLS